MVMNHAPARRVRHVIASVMLRVTFYALALVHAACARDIIVDYVSPPQPPPAVVASDIDRLAGPAWQGSLTYLDYTSRTPTTIRSGLVVTRLPDADPPSWSFNISYADEPHADNGITVRLTDDGRVFDGAAVVQTTHLVDDTIEIITEELGQDDNRPARIRHVLVIRPRECAWRKLVLFDGDHEFIQRSEYRWRR